MWQHQVFFLSSFIVLASGTLTNRIPCYNNTVCGANQCCYIKPKFLIVSKRQAIQLPSQLDTHAKPKQGYCEDYQPLRTPCSPFDKLNGHCSCEHTLTCRFVPAPNTGNIVRRKLVMPGPGAYECAPPL